MAIHSPNTGIVDFAAVTHSYSEDLYDRGGEVITDYEVTNPCVLPYIVWLTSMREYVAAARE